MRKLDIESVKDIINKKYNGKISILSTEYINNKSPLLVKCNDCGMERSVSFNRLSINSCCPRCSRKEKGTTESFKDEVKKLYGSEYTVLGEYINRHTKIEIKHNKCGKTFSSSPSNFISGHKCPHCAHKAIKYTLEEYSNKFVSIKDFEILDIYSNNRNNVLLKCKKCGEILERSMYYGTKQRIVCPECNGTQSVPAALIAEYLSSNNITFQKEYYDIRLKGDGRTYLKFDFFLTEYNTLIEFDGRQHFDIGYKGLPNKDTHKRDLIKNKFVQKDESGRTLYRIKYDCFLTNKNVLLNNDIILQKIDYIMKSIILKKRSTTNKKKVFFISKCTRVKRNVYYSNYKPK